MMGKTRMVMATTCLLILGILSVLVAHGHWSTLQRRRRSATAGGDADPSAWLGVRGANLPYLMDANADAPQPDPTLQPIWNLWELPHEAEKPSVQEGGSSTVTVSANRAGAAHPGAVPEADEVPLEKVADPQTGSRTVAVSEEKTRPFQSTAVPGVEGEKNSKAERLLGFQTHFLIFAGTFFCLCLLLSLLVAVICLYKKRKRIPSPSSVAQDNTSSSHTSKESDLGSNTIQQNVIWTQGQQPPAVPGSSSVPQLTSQTAGICGTGLSPSSEKASCLSPLVTIPKEARKWSQKQIITTTIYMTDRNLGSAEDLAALPEADTSSNLKLNEPAGSAKGTGATQAGEVGKGLIRAQP
ncbi:uncharacterized protein LOC133627316 [Colius striatus]|uniref:uncharacterized protein LOC133627316 n=1 Tax=Colius striatus TaxID=57412 RepID=UPI002B1E1D2D|nr:uncharacterized protein LOC133627316 [Colius striatus]